MFSRYLSVLSLFYLDVSKYLCANDLKNLNKCLHLSLTHTHLSICLFLHNLCLLQKLFLLGLLIENECLEVSALHVAGNVHLLQLEVAHLGKEALVTLCARLVALTVGYTVTCGVGWGGAS